MSAPLSPGGTTVENGIETVTVSAPRETDWGKYLLIFAIASLGAYLLAQKSRR